MGLTLSRRRASSLTLFIFIHRIFSSMNLLFSAVVVALAVANGVVGASADNIRCAQSACSEEMLACFSDYGCSAQIPILGQLADVTNLPPRLAENAALAAVAKCLGTAACVVRRATAEKPSLRVNDGTVSSKLSTPLVPPSPLPKLFSHFLPNQPHPFLFPSCTW